MMPLLIAGLAPPLTFGLYVIAATVLFHRRVVRRPLVALTGLFLPFLAIQTLVVRAWLSSHGDRSSDCELSVLALAYGLPCLLGVLLGMAYVQFYCLMEFSISLRMLDHVLAHPRRRLSFAELRSEYPLEEMVARKCAAAGSVGLLRARAEEGELVLDMQPRGVRVVRFLARLKAFLNWDDEG